MLKRTPSAHAMRDASWRVMMQIATNFLSRSLLAMMLASGSLAADSNMLMLVCWSYLALLAPHKITPERQHLPGWLFSA